jgi:hypothetical protein
MQQTHADSKEVKWLDAHILCSQDDTDMQPGIIQEANECGGPAKLCGSVWAL